MLSPFVTNSDPFFKILLLSLLRALLGIRCLLSSVLSPSLEFERATTISDVIDLSSRGVK